MADKIKGRLQTPIDETTGERKDIHLITTSDEVLVPDGNNEPKILTNVLIAGPADYGVTFHTQITLSQLRRPTSTANI